MVGTTVSHFKILEKLGEGGMGVVYKAEDLALSRTVALKFLPHGLEAHELERARFLQEARAAAILNHPHICTIHEIGESEGQQFIVMEYVDGVTLREKLSEGKLPITNDVAIAIQIGEALEQAHAKGIVHRDIKPENIMVAGSQVKVMDFGLAKLKGSLKLTKSSSTIGTVAYMAPEQIEGKETDSRSDIFSFGVVLYEMLTGHLPFSGEHEAAVMYSIVNEEPESLQRFLPDAPSELVHIVNRALEKDPEERYQSVRDMVIDLRRLKKESTRVVRLPGREPEVAAVSPGLPPARSKRRLAKILVGGAVLVCAAVAYLLLSAGPRLNPAMKSRVVQLPFRNVSYASISRDGSWIAFPAADERGKFDVYMMNVAQGQPRRITYDSCYHIYSVSLSPDAGTILYSRLFRLNVINPYEIVSISSLGGTGRVVVAEGYNQAWMPDGKRFGYLREQSVGPGLLAHQWWSSKPDGSESRMEFADTTAAMAALRVAYHYSPDGKSIVWTKNFPGGYSEIMIRDRVSGTDRQLTHDGKFADDALWTETGNVFYSSSRGGNVNIWMIPAGGGEPLQITRGSGPDSPLGLTPDGKRLLYSEVQDIGQVRIASVKDGSGRQLTVDEWERGMASISPSGRYVAFTAQEIDAVSTARNVYVMDRDGGNVRKLTDDGRFKGASAWSPDEKWITYSARPGNEPEDSCCVFLVQADNPGQPRLMGRGEYTHWFTQKEFVLWGTTGTLVRSIDQGESVRYGGDSVMAIPVLAGKYVVALDLHAERTGYHITSSAHYSTSGLEKARKLTSGLSWAVFPPGAAEMYYVPAGSRELHRVLLPEGKDTIVRKFPGLGLFYSFCPLTGEIAYTETYRKMRFVLVEDVFK